MKSSPSFINLIRNIPIFARLLIILFCFVIVPNICLTLFFNKVAAEQLVDNIKLNYENTVVSLESLMRERMNAVNDLMVNISLDIELRSAIEENKAEEMNKRLLYHINTFPRGYRPYLINLQIVSDHQNFGTFVKYQQGEPVNCDFQKLSEQEYYHKSINNTNSPIWANTLEEKNMYRLSLNPATYIYNYLSVIVTISNGGPPLATFILNLSPRIFMDLYNSNPDNYESFFLVGSDSFVVALSSNTVRHEDFNEIISDSWFIRNKSLDKLINKKNYIVAFTSTIIDNWYVVGVAEKNKVYRHVNRVRDVTLAVSLLVCIFSGFFAFLFSLSISMPLSRLTISVNSIGENDLELDYEDQSKDDIALLGRNYIQMLQRVKQLMSKIVANEVARKNEELKRKQAELNALQIQIKPHFIYNTLDLIRWYTMKFKDDKISSMLLEFSRLLSYGVKKEGNLSCLGDELAHTKTYLSLIRNTKDITIDFTVTEITQNYLDYPITKLTIQPIIENSVIHGLKEGSKEIQISLSARKKKETLEIVIMDQGRGLDEEGIKELNTSVNQAAKKPGVGLRNINSRLKLCFGEDYGLLFESVEGEYFKVIILLPLAKEQQMQ